jgi:diaminohydroxyphosphoribosylaminopyrimidine deaminase / 5-amino-6-(5-phosphoribosylamino)uracil reductase
VTTPDGAARTGARQRLEERGAVVHVADGTLKSALASLAQQGITSLLIEGGASLAAAAWDDRVVDFVRLYVTPHVFGPAGVRFLPGRRLAPAMLSERRVEPIGPDVLIEGYVHGPC